MKKEQEQLIEKKSIGRRWGERALQVAVAVGVGAIALHYAFYHPHEVVGAVKSVFAGHGAVSGDILVRR